MDYELGKVFMLNINSIKVAAASRHLNVLPLFTNLLGVALLISLWCHLVEQTLNWSKLLELCSDMADIDSLPIIAYPACLFSSLPIIAYQSMPESNVPCTSCV